MVAHQNVVPSFCHAADAPAHDIPTAYCADKIQKLRPPAKVLGAHSKRNRVDDHQTLYRLAQFFKCACDTKRDNGTIAMTGYPIRPRARQRVHNEIYIFSGSHFLDRRQLTVDEGKRSHAEKWLTGTKRRCQVARVISGAIEDTIEEEEWPFTGLAGMNLNNERSFGSLTTLNQASEPPNGRRFKQDSIGNLFIRQPLGFYKHLKASERIAASLEEIIIDPNIVSLERTLPHGEELVFKFGFGWSSRLRA